MTGLKVLLNVNGEGDTTGESTESHCQFGDVVSQNYSPTSLLLNPRANGTQDEGYWPSEELATQVQSSIQDCSSCKIRTEEKEHNDSRSRNGSVFEEVTQQTLEVVVLDAIQVYLVSLSSNGNSFLRLFKLFCNLPQVTSEGRQLGMRISIHCCSVAAKSRWIKRLLA